MEIEMNNMNSNANNTYDNAFSSVTPEELENWDKDSYRIIDVREDADYEKDSIPGSIHLPLDGILNGSAKLPAEIEAGRGSLKLVLVCRYGRLSEDAAIALSQRGYSAYNLEGGYGRYVYENARRAAEDEKRREDIEKSIRGRFKKALYGRFCHAICEYDLVQPGDKIAVCISGGKDSMCMAKLFQEVKRHNKFPFELVFLVMDPGYNEYNRRVIESNAALLGIPITIFETQIFDSVYKIDQSPCYLCARMRRGYLYKEAQKLGCNKIALGHHYDDVIETILMGMLYSGQFQAMMPKLKSTNYQGLELIRPMYFIREDDIKRWRDMNGLHFIQCACKFTDTCTTCRANGDTGSKRLETKQLIAKLKETNPYIEANLFKSMENVPLSKILGWKDVKGKHSFLEVYDRENGPMIEGEEEFPDHGPKRMF